MFSFLFKSDKKTIGFFENKDSEKTDRSFNSSYPQPFQYLLKQKKDVEKNQIFYHRSYRKLKQYSFIQILIMLILLVGTVDFFVILFYPEITQAISKVTSAVLTSVVSNDLVDIISKNYIYNDLYIVTLPGRYPTLKLSIIVAIISLIFFFFAIYLKRVIEPKMGWLIFATFVNLSAAIFFIFFSGYFPYDLEIFSEMYIKTEVGIWLIIPFILSIALLPFPIKIYKKFATIVLTILYSIVFACVRYIVFLYLLRNATYLFMPMMFFMLGPFLDFVYIVCSYSLCLSSVGKQTQKNLEQWNWLY